MRISVFENLSVFECMTFKVNHHQLLNSGQWFMNANLFNPTPCSPRSWQIWRHYPPHSPWKRLPLLVLRCLQSCWSCSQHTSRKWPSQWNTAQYQEYEYHLAAMNAAWGKCNMQIETLNHQERIMQETCFTMEMVGEKDHYTNTYSSKCSNITDVFPNSRCLGTWRFRSLCPPMSVRTNDDDIYGPELLDSTWERHMFIHQVEIQHSRGWCFSLFFYAPLLNMSCDLDRFARSYLRANGKTRGRWVRRFKAGIAFSIHWHFLGAGIV